MKSLFSYFLVICMMSIGTVGCMQDSQNVQNTGWAIVNIGRIKGEVRKKIEEENPFPSALLKRIQSNDKDGLKTKTEIDKMMTEAIVTCARSQAEESDGSGRYPVIEMVAGLRKIAHGHKAVMTLITI